MAFLIRQVVVDAANKVKTAEVKCHILGAYFMTYGMACSAF